MTADLDTEGTVPVDAVLSAAANARRRSVLRALSRTDGNGMGLDTLVDRILEDVRSGASPEADRRNRVGLALQHTHLPKLDACGVIAYDDETKRVRSTGDELIRDLLVVVESHETRER